MGSIDLTVETLDDFKPWTTLNKTYIDTFDEYSKENYNVTTQDPYDEGDWTNEVLSEKVFSGKHGANKPWKHFIDETVFETERE